MKKFFAMLCLVLCCAVSLIACNRDNGEVDGTEGNDYSGGEYLCTGLSSVPNVTLAAKTVTSLGDGYFLLTDESFNAAIIKGGGEMVLPFEYVTARKITDGVTAVRGKNGWGYYNVALSKFIVECKYEELIEFSEGIGGYFDGERYRYIYTDGSFAIERGFIEAVPFSDGYARVMTEDSLGYIDKSGSIVIHCDYEDFDDFHDGLARVSENGDLGYMDKKGEIAFAVDCHRLEAFSEGLAQIVKGGKAGYVNAEGEVVLEAQWEALPDNMASAFYGYTDGVAPFMRDGKYGFIDKSGAEIIEAKYIQVNLPSEKVVRVRGEDRLYGFRGVDGSVISECIYDTAGDFNGGAAYVSKDGEFFYINTEGEVISEESYAEASAFSGDYAMVRKKDSSEWSFVKREITEV